MPDPNQSAMADFMPFSDFLMTGQRAQEEVDSVLTSLASLQPSTTYPASNVVIPSTTVPAPPEPQGIGYWCPQCQKWTNGFPCAIHFQPLPAAGLGWECPRCRAIHAPWVSGCDCRPLVLGSAT